MTAVCAGSQADGVGLASTDVSMVAHCFRLRLCPALALMSGSPAVGSGRLLSDTVVVRCGGQARRWPTA